MLETERLEPNPKETDVDSIVIEHLYNIPYTDTINNNNTFPHHNNNSCIKSNNFFICNLFQIFTVFSRMN